MIKAMHMRRGLIILAASLMALPAILAGQSAVSTNSTRPAATQPGAAHAPTGARFTDEGWFAPRQVSSEHTPRPDRPSHVYVIPIREPISEKTLDSIRRKTLQARAHGVDVLVFDMDTWGGDLFAALDISRLIKVDLKSIHTVCYVRTRAVSAGSMIALACDDIIGVPGGLHLGDSAPISGAGQKIEGVEREKLESVTRSEFADSARRNGYPVALAESMVSMHLEVWLVRNQQTRELRYVLADEFRNNVVNPPAQRSSGRDGDPGRDAPASSTGPKLEWELLRVAVSDRQLLSMDSEQSAERGFLSAVIPAEDPPYPSLMKELNASGQPTVLEDTWSETLVGFLTSPGVTGILLFLAILFAYVEMNTPGFGVPGTLAIVCFAILFGSRYLTGLALWWEVAVFVIGLLLLLVEVFILPGFGVPGVTGIILMLVGLVMIAINNAPDQIPLPSGNNDWMDWSAFRNTLLAMSIGLVAGIVGALAVGRYLPKLPVANRLVLAPTEVGSAPSLTAGVTVGQIGTARTVCRPIGKAMFGEQLLDVICEGGMIQAGETVRIVRLNDNAVVVEKA